MTAFGLRFSDLGAIMSKYRIQYVDLYAFAKTEFGYKLSIWRNCLKKQLFFYLITGVCVEYTGQNKQKPSLCFTEL